MKRSTEGDEDLKWLRVRLSRSSSWAFGLTSVFLLPIVALHLWLAAGYAHLLHLSFAEGFHAWLSDLDPMRQYSGLEVRMMQQFDKVALESLFVLAIWVWVPIQHRERQQARRLLAYIERLSIKAGEADLP